MLRVQLERVAGAPACQPLACGHCKFQQNQRPPSVWILGSLELRRLGKASLHTFYLRPRSGGPREAEPRGHRGPMHNGPGSFPLPLLPGILCCCHLTLELKCGALLPAFHTGEAGSCFHLPKGNLVPWAQHLCPLSLLF